MKKLLLIFTIILLSSVYVASQNTYKGKTGEQWFEEYYRHKSLKIAVKKLNYPPAQYYVAWGYYENGWGLWHFKNKRKALAWYRKSADGGYTHAQYKLGSHYYYKYDYDQAEYWYLKAIAQEGKYPDNYPNPRFYISSCYRGLGDTYVKKNDYRKAVECYQKEITLKEWNKESELGVPAYRLAELYERGGYGIDKDLEKSYKYYSIAAKAKDKKRYHWCSNFASKEEPDAACERLKPLVDKIVAERKAQDHARKIQELDNEGKILANSNDENKITALAKRYDELGDKGKYFAWTKKAADLGNGIAQWQTAVCYKNGYGVTQNYTNAYEYFLKAANQRYSVAFEELATCYHYGKGVPKNTDKAVYWYKQAAATGCTTAKSKLKELVPPNPTAGIDKVWIEHNVKQDGKNGINIHIKFHTSEMDGETGQCVVYFYNPDKSKMTARTEQSSEYKTKDGQACISKNFQPNYENAVYNDFVVFMPKNALTYPKGENYYCKVYLWYKNKTLCSSDYYPFKETSTIWDEADYSLLPAYGVLPQTKLELYYSSEKSNVCKISIRPPETTYAGYGMYRTSYTSPYYIFFKDDRYSTYGLEFYIATNTSFIFKKEQNLGSKQYPLVKEDVLEISKDWKTIKFKHKYGNINYENFYNIPISKSYYDEFLKVREQLFNLLLSSGGNYSPGTSTNINSSDYNTTNNSNSTVTREKCIICVGDGKCRGMNHCDGTGKCTTCFGKGYTNNPYTGDNMRCPSCNGSGKCYFCSGTGRCSTCGGTGYKNH